MLFDGPPAKFGTSKKKATTIEPAAGNRNYQSGAVGGQGTNGDWWSSTPYSESNGHNLNFNSNNVNPVTNNYASYGFPVRCVAR